MIVGFYEDGYPQQDHDLLEQYMSTFAATRAYKGAIHHSVDMFWLHFCEGLRILRSHTKEYSGPVHGYT